MVWQYTKRQLISRLVPKMGCEGSREQLTMYVFMGVLYLILKLSHYLNTNPLMLI